jgi:hypothetical protein
MIIEVSSASSISIGLKSGIYYRLNPGQNEVHEDFVEELLENPSLDYLESVGEIKIIDGSVNPTEHDIGMSVDKKAGLPVSVPDSVSDTEVKSKVVPSSKKGALSKKREVTDVPTVIASGESSTPIADLDFTPGKA